MNLLQIIEEQASAQAFTRVRAVYLEVGKLSCVEPDALRLCFEAARKETRAEEAELHIAIVPALAWCRGCEKEIGISEFMEPCPDCGSFGLELRGGTELKVRELEVD